MWEIIFIYRSIDRSHYVGKISDINDNVMFCKMIFKVLCEVYE